MQEITYAKGKNDFRGSLQTEQGTLDVVCFSILIDERTDSQTGEIYILGEFRSLTTVFRCRIQKLKMPRMKKKSAEERLRPIYPSSEKIDETWTKTKFFQTVQANIISQIPQLIEENLPVSLMKSLRLMSRQQAYLNIHFPQNADFAKHADRRLKFEEVLFSSWVTVSKKLQQKFYGIGNLFPIVGEISTILRKFPSFLN